MPKPIQPDRKSADRLADVAARLQEYATCVQFAEWLAENKWLSGGAANQPPAELAYSFAVRFSNLRADLDTILGPPVIDSARREAQS